MTGADGFRSSAWLAVLFAGALAAAGCGGGSPSPSYTKIDDMEGATNALEWIPSPAAGPGVWSTATDCTQADRIFPPPHTITDLSYALLPAPHETMSGTVSTHAARFRTTSPLVDIWGANMSIGFTGETGDGGAGPGDAGASTDDAGAPGDDAGACTNVSALDFPAPTADLTAFAGVTFWARAESPGGRLMRVQVVDVNTDPRGGICQDSVSAASDYCYNGFGVEVELTDTFRQYTLDFSRFAQQGGWGYHPPSGIDWSRVYLMNFEMDLPSCTTSPTSMCAGGAPALSFDIWIDDLYFVNK
jgi:hypothetical protein